MLPILLNSLAVTLSLSTATGVFLHDMHIDKAASAAMATPMVTPNYDGGNKLTNLSPDLHTHAERHSFGQVVHELGNANPRIQPRTNEDKKHMLQKHIARGHHPFDNYSLPLV